MKMNSFNTNAHDFRSSSKRKCFSLTCCLIFVLLMSQASCRPSETDNDNGSSDALTYNDKDYVDPDDIDWKNFAAVETTSKVHPIIYYKEDIVSEDYDPSKEKSKKKTEEEDPKKVKEIKPHHSRRKYKEISRHHRHRNQTESYRYIKPEKVYFDINPIEHQGGSSTKEHSDEDDYNKFNEDDIHIEVISLLDDEEDNTNPKDIQNESKNLLNKNPKKYNHRHRRDVRIEEDEDTMKNIRLRHKRNPFYNPVSHYSNVIPMYGGVPYKNHLFIYSKVPVRSPNYNLPGYVPKNPTPTPSSVGNRVGISDDDLPVWGSVDLPPSVNTQAPPRTLPPRRPPPSILQSGDEDYRASPNRNTRPPATQRTTPRPRTTPRTTQRPTPAQESSPRTLSACIWAISSCCDNRNTEIRYQCFERLGCQGAFWDLNPCADDIYRSAVDAADQFLD
ncbi:uncharacterized protein LOC129913939 isoform X2 [Episyrphus balteatus]|uniref:uncharacterized protein LOC129913939 isoform X2 n=1 Tax=Episyrphus balteatus TaxID=286459 RepID=UPI002485906E|nr:uncharacterized protein LOC129913939 isoform X2 [Episyrphus balteatus]